ncbi:MULTISPECIES: hypothetical protein [Methylobacterium]|uniref:Uncharacterized protein n=1 Tax=Methylobacterium radiotolerans (strain ATCC 27329 / DSM 1819 / JCM 2831 / NBRC 15690 / NCIMB 10815 / 0-1) TaxID=426355 RepID=B1M175_METRJ|nr:MULTISPECIES: hypothetical protein [Methylobacterium]ACB24625.1 hypothetical protein Mrad2831_2641 [Methylobacterium radiotolerans JCM 2831]MBE7249546.1 hypothetical protein [Actinomycetospora chiangmaiensis]GEM97102.1 hypothetical protein MRA01_16420 [Methylobacterium radiotolerans]
MRKPKPVPNLWQVVRHSWSFQLNAVATVASSVVLGMSVLAGAPPINLVWFAVGYGLVNLVATGARLIAQPEVSGDAS